jgi:hypothetical protein
MKIIPAGSLLLFLCLAASSCKKESDSPGIIPADKLRVRLYSTNHKGETSTFRYHYDGQNRLDSMRYTHWDGQTGVATTKYTLSGFEQGNSYYLTDNAGRIVTQTFPDQKGQVDYKYDAAGRLYQNIALNTQDNREIARFRYTWDDNNNLVQAGYVLVEFDTTGRRLVKDSILTVYSNFTEPNTVGPKAFGFDRLGTAPITTLWNSLSGAKYGKMLPANQSSTRYLFATPQANALDYTSVRADLPVTYSYTKDAKGRLYSVVYLLEGKPFTETYEYYD